MKNLQKTIVGLLIGCISADEFQDWKGSLEDMQLFKNVRQKYESELDRAASRTAKDRRNLESSSHDSVSSTSQKIPITDSSDSYSQSISLGKNGNIQVNPGGKEGKVVLNLLKEDKMIIQAFNDGTCTMNFKGTDGTKLDMTAKNHYISLDFTDKEGNSFYFTSDGNEFQIPGLRFDMKLNRLVVTAAQVDQSQSSDHRRRLSESSHEEPAHEEETHETVSSEPDDHAQQSDDHSSSQEEHHTNTKISSPPGTYTMQDFAIYTKNYDQSATLKLSSLGLTLNLNYIDQSGKEKKEEEKHEDEEEEGHATDDILGIKPEWNYDMHGSDWPDAYPNCASSHQSPINLLDAETEYGQTYNIYDFADDYLVPTYWDLEFPMVNFDLSKYTVDVYIDHSHGYAGFESQLGKTLFNSDEKWDGFEFIIHSPSDHTINGKRFDLELQIYHIKHKNTEEEDGVGEDTEQAVHRRRMSADASAAAAEEDHGDSTEEESAGAHGGSSKDDDPLYQIQENPKMENSAISILFSIDDHDDVDYDTKHMFEEFFHDMKFEEHNPTVEKIHFGYMMDHIDWAHRWIYKGSKTIPPCDKFVYWNVIHTVYPIEAISVKLFKEKLSEGGIHAVGEAGNYRETQLGFNPDVAYVKSGSFNIFVSSLVIVMGILNFF